MSASETGSGRRVGDVAERRDHHGARLADRGHGLTDVLGLDDADGDDRGVRALAVGERLGELGGLLHGLDARASRPSSCAFSRLNATGSTAMTLAAPGVRRALDRVDPDRRRCP